MEMKTNKNIKIRIFSLIVVVIVAVLLLMVDCIKLNSTSHFSSVKVNDVHDLYEQFICYFLAAAFCLLFSVQCSAINFWGIKQKLYFIILNFMSFLMDFDSFFLCIKIHNEHENSPMTLCGLINVLNCFAQ